MAIKVLQEVPSDDLNQIVQNYTYHIPLLMQRILTVKTRLTQSKIMAVITKMTQNAEHIRVNALKEQKFFKTLINPQFRLLFIEAFKEMKHDNIEESSRSFLMTLNMEVRQNSGIYTAHGSVYKVNSFKNDDGDVVHIDFNVRAQSISFTVQRRFICALLNENNVHYSHSTNPTYFEAFFSSIQVLPMEITGDDRDIVINVEHVKYKSDIDSPMQEINGVYSLILTLTGTRQILEGFGKFYGKFKPFLSSGDPMDIDNDVSLLSLQTDASFLDDTFSLDHSIDNQKFALNDRAVYEQPNEMVNRFYEVTCDEYTPSSEYKPAKFEIYCDEEHEDEMNVAEAATKDQNTEKKFITKPKRKLNPNFNVLEQILEVSEISQNSRLLEEEEIETPNYVLIKNDHEMMEVEDENFELPTQAMIEIDPPAEIAFKKVENSDQEMAEMYEDEMAANELMKVAFREEILNEETVEEIRKEIAFCQDGQIIKDGTWKRQHQFLPRRDWEDDLEEIGIKFTHRPAVLIHGQEATLKAVNARMQAIIAVERKERQDHANLWNAFKEHWDQRNQNGRLVEAIKNLSLEQEKVVADDFYQIPPKHTKDLIQKSRRKIAFDIGDSGDECQKAIESILWEFNESWNKIEDSEFESNSEEEDMEIEQTELSIEKSQVSIESSIDEGFDIRDAPRKRHQDEVVEIEAQKASYIETYAEFYEKLRERYEEPDLNVLFNTRPLSPNRPPKVIK